MYRNKYRRYKRRYSRRRNSYKRNIFKSRFGKKVRSVLSKTVDTKYIDFSPDTISLQNGADVYFNAIHQGIGIGSGVSNRIGNKIYARYGLFNCLFNSQAIAGIYVRVCVVQAMSNGYGATNFVQNVNDFWDKERFIVIYDKTINLGISDENGRNKTLHKFQCKFMRTVMYDDGASTTIPFKPFYFFAMANDSVLPSPTLDLKWRLYYKDA